MANPPVTWSLPLPDRIDMATVRRWVRGCLAGNGQIDDVVLVVVELVTNAYVHAGFPVGLTVLVRPDTVQVEVTDPDATVPHVRRSESRLGGNGLVIVDKISSAWGTRLREQGKTVWARLPLAARSA
jgi:anti-sigma regulatory factor (Ser/Thr protein kinase)